MQKWKKLGQLFNVNNNADWAVTHSMMPCTLFLRDGTLRVYFSPRDKFNQSRPASIDINLDTLTCSNFTQKSILDLGDLGAFDDSGIMPTCVVEFQDSLYMFYNGWTLGKKIPFWSFNSLAISRDGGASFIKVSKSSRILYRNEVDPYSTFAPFVLIENDIWKMWYVSCTKWTIEDGTPKHYYHIKYAESADGLNWNREGLVCIDFKTGSEYAIARPMVIKEGGKYKMWYSYRAGVKHHTYRIGYAESFDGKDWIRKDEEVGLEPSENGWDSEMVCYSYVFDYKGERYMLYNGNGYGRTGFGLAILER
jgi:hypothetical protein